MRLFVMKSKIHRACVTETNLDYIGSIAIDQDLMDKSNIIINEKVLVVNITNGLRWETYVIPASRGSKTISPNGGGARLCVPGDLLVIMAFADIEPTEIIKPKVLFLDENNDLMGENELK